MQKLLKNTKKTLGKKLVVGFLISVFVFGGAFSSPSTTNAQTQSQIDALLAQIAQLQAQVAALLGNNTSCYNYTRSLTVGSTGADVVELQTLLVSKGYLIIPTGVSKGYFGPLTRGAVARYQAAFGIAPAVGYFGPITIAHVKANCSVTTSPNPTTPTSPKLQGGAGSVDSYDLLSGINNEEVGEDQEDVEVIGLEIEVSDGSDINITAIKLNFDQGTASEDFEDYADEVSIWLAGKEIARVDADRFNDDNGYQATISMDRDAIIRANRKADLTVAISGVRNLDSADAGDTWTVDVTSIRFVDAQGATISEDPGTASRTLSFEDFATAVNAELKISNGDDDINNARIINVDASNDTDDVELFSFDLEAKGKSDIEIRSLPVLFTTTGADLDDIANTLYLVIDGKRVASESVPTSATTTSLIVFDDVDYTIDAGDKVEVIVVADINDLDGSFTEGDTITVAFGESETDNTSFVARDEARNRLSDANKTGSASSGTHAFYDVGIKVSLVSVSETGTAQNGSNNDTATFTIKYKITALDGDIYVGNTATATTSSSVSSTVPSNQVLYLVDKSGTATTDNLSAVVSFVPNGSKVTNSGVSNGVKIKEGETGTFTLTVTRTNDTTGDAGLFRAALAGISWATSDTATQNVFNFNIEDYRTNYVFID